MFSIWLGSFDKRWILSSKRPKSFQGKKKPIIAWGKVFRIPRGGEERQQYSIAPREVQVGGFEHPFFLELAL